MSYSWFDLDSELDPKARPEGVKINGMGKVMKVYNSGSRSTEEFIVGALTSLGESERTLCYVNSSLNGLSDRLNLAAKIARPVNAAKARGVEGFSSVPYLNPWEYAIESKVGDFFKKIWAAICSICRKIVEAITNFIKYIANAISGAMTKSQAKDLDFYKKNKKTIDPKVKAAGIGSSEISTLPWKGNAASYAKYIQSLMSMVTKATSAKKQDKEILDGVSRADLRTMATEADFNKAFGKIFGFSSIGSVGSSLKGAATGTGATYARAAAVVKNYTDDIKKQIGDVFSAIGTAGGKENASPRGAVTLAFFGTLNPKVGKMKISEIANKAGKDFDVLSNEWLSANVNKTVATIHSMQKDFVAYTKTVDMVAKKFDKVQASAHSKVASLSQLTAQLAKERNKLNNVMSTLVIESVFNIFRFRRTCHIALKAYISAGKGGVKDSKKSGESLQSIESMFNFD